MNTTRLIFLLVPILFISCNQKDASKKTVTEEAIPAKNQDATKKNRADILTQETISAHGGELYDKAHYAFTFRNKRYTFRNDKGRYIYTVKSVKNGDEIYDTLENGRLTRRIDNNIISLSEKDVAKYSEALNSVIYFATLPHKLADPAVNRTYLGTTTIKNNPYDILGITFQEEGGGKDFDDEFHYWINQDTKTVDYLAYSYSTNDGGVRFRAAYNPRNIDGIRFQDYINYEAPIGTPLKELPKLYEEGRLKALSRIITEDVMNLKN
ncbi:hypothetical protein FK220_016210 [Flavobacteriaceae bacterium TP-CH-4]|uniref:Deoxyribose-phosphate aldolase n=1 Tax=Pelagihabitans pacificus TaxID=2696054 RepID=A0A967B0K0_9FLAO|nr:DUF6503 family protein [Pelagihabitans pacificus]NHF60897.1 hypothetical protein [Pelagihabitans pacificus]